MDESQKFFPLPQPDEISIREKEDAMGAYLMMFASIAAGLPLPIINLIAAIIYYYINKGKSRFVKFHATQSLFSQIPTSLINAGAVSWGAYMFFHDITFPDIYWGYLVMALIANIIYFVFSIIAAVKARRGKFYYFVFFGKLAYIKAYTKDDNLESENLYRNIPPDIS